VAGRAQARTSLWNDARAMTPDRYSPAMRARDLGIRIGLGTPGPLNAITDVEGVTVGHTTLIHGDGPLVVGQGPVRTGVTVVCPRGRGGLHEAVFAGCHRLNGNGELTGLEWVRESGTLTSPVAITNTHSVGIVRDALVAASVRGDDATWSLPVVGETYDGLLNDMNGFHVRAEHLHEALAAADGGPVAEGTVGGGTGMICHEFKGGIGTASRVIDAAAGGFTVGALVQANYGRRDWLRIDGVRVGEAIPTTEVPSPYDEVGRQRSAPSPGSGSIIVVVATDAPLLPHQCERLAQRAGLGIARVGGTGGHTSGDLFIAFATGNRLPSMVGDEHPAGLGTYDVRAVGDVVIDRLFDAAIESVEEAIVNALVAATTVTGRDGITAHALPHDRLREVMAAHGR
jgi:D-aminopeptidase